MKSAAIVVDFDSKAHIYRIKGKRVPSVTQICGVLKDVSSIPIEVLRNAGERGKHVHTLTELFDENKLSVTTLAPELMDGLMYLKGYKAFRKDHKDIKTVEIEAQVLSLEKNYIGRLDRITQRNIHEVGDVKSNSKISGTFGLQLAAYQRAKNEINSINWPKGKKTFTVEGRFVIHLTKKGTYNFIDEGYALSLKQLKNAQVARIAAGYILNYKESLELFDRCHVNYVKGARTLKDLITLDPELYSIAKLIKEKDDSVPWKR